MITYIVALSRRGADDFLTLFLHFILSFDARTDSH